MLFNSTFLLGLTLSSYTNNSPLFTIPSSLINSNLQFKSFHFSRFLTTSIEIFDLKPSMIIYDSSFSYFLNTAISIQSCNNFVGRAYQEITRFSLSSCSSFLNCTFKNCESNKRGGAIYIDAQGNAQFIIDRTTFISCSGSPCGGAIYLSKDLNGANTTQISFCKFEKCFVKNTTANDNLYGGSVYCQLASGTVNFRCSVFDQSSIQGGLNAYGGAIYAEMPSVDKQFFFANFSNCQCIDQSNSSYGGAICLNLSDYNPQNISYNSFDTCNATNGSCMYISSTTLSNISFNYIFLNNNDGTLFELSRGSIVIVNPYHISLQGINPDGRNISFSNGNYTNCYQRYDCRLFLRSQDIHNMASKLTSIGFNPTFASLFIPFSPPPNADMSIEAGLPGEPTGSFTISDPFTHTLPPEAPQETAPTNSSLSTIAIIFIVIACILVVIAIVVIVILVLRQRGMCKTSFERNFGHEMGSTSYF